jgi:hypothetical protein
MKVFARGFLTCRRGPDGLTVRYMAGMTEDFSFLDEPTFTKTDEKFSCVVRVRCNGSDWIVQLELDDGRWRVTSDAAVLDACPSLVETVTRYARDLMH